jgi:Ala-tRNA(Pro) deacylase
MHPLVNDRTIGLSRDAFLAVMDRLGVEIQWV